MNLIKYYQEKLYIIFRFYTSQKVSDLDRQIERDLNQCRNVHIVGNTTGFKHCKTTFQQINSTQFRNPCWYNFHPIPNSPLIPVITMNSMPRLTYDPVKSKQLLKQVKSSGKRHLYCLPTFFLSRFAKCGTTTMYEMLVKHPLVAKTACKEPLHWTQFVNKRGTDLDKKVHAISVV